jgi:hypothetical protein
MIKIACADDAPCRTFAFALTVTNAGGEIDVVDPAGYGSVTITKSVSIVNDGAGVAVIEGLSGSVTITAGAGDSVHLRGLTIQGLGSGNGIQFTTGGNLAIENCVVRNFGNGIAITPSTSSSFSVSNTIASNNSNDGIHVEPTGSAAVTGVLSRVMANKNQGRGIIAIGFSTTGASVNVTIVDSVASNNPLGGIVASTASGNAATAVTVRNSVASNSNSPTAGVGLGAFDTAVLRVAHSVITGNTRGVDVVAGGVPNGTLASYGENDIDGNTNNNTGVLTTIPTH